METPQTEAAVPQKQEEKKKRSPWLVVLIIFLIVMMCCCLTGALLCRGGAMLPDFLERYLRDVPGLENVDDIWELVEDVINDPDFDPANIDPEDFLPEDFLEDDFGDEQSICNGLSGNFEMQILVGPAEAADLEPFGVGSIPFRVESDQGNYRINSRGTIDFEDERVENWGTYTVFFDMVGVIDGVCSEDDTGAFLDFTFLMVGHQMFVVDAGGLQNEYPTDFDHEFDYVYPVVDGATEFGESWALILHLD